MNYNLFTTASMTTVWGDGSAGTSTVLLRKVNGNRPVTTTIYGRSPRPERFRGGVLGLGDGDHHSVTHAQQEGPAESPQEGGEVR